MSESLTVNLYIIDKDYYLLRNCEIKEGDFYIEFLGLPDSLLVHRATKKSLESWNSDENNKDNFERRCSKLLASSKFIEGIPLLKIEQCNKVAGMVFFDIDKLMDRHFVQRRDEGGNYDWDEKDLYYAKKGFQTAFKEAESLYNEILVKTFTRKQAFNIFDEGVRYGNSYDEINESDKETECYEVLRNVKFEIEVEKEENQCDGCKANLPYKSHLIHNEGNGSLGISCTKSLYQNPKVVDGYVNLLIK